MKVIPPCFGNAGIVAAVLLLMSQSESYSQANYLFNGYDLSGWVMVLREETVDPRTVWSAQDGKLVCTGTTFGYIRSEKSYTNYHLQLEWRWPENPGNSGLFLHVQEPDNVWPKCIEAQLLRNQAGNIILMGQATVSEPTVEGTRRVARKGEATEKEPGEWNRFDVFVNGDSLVFYVNGVLQNALSGADITSGYIGLQSEGAPIEFRNILLRPLPMAVAGSE